MKAKNYISNEPPFGVTPILVADNASAAADFYKRAFNAIEIARIGAPGGKRLLHLRMQIFESIVVLMDEFPELAGEESEFHTPASLKGTTITLHLQVTDAHKVWEKAISEGAIPLIPMAKQFWEEYYGRLKDPFGHEWTIAQMIEHLTDSEVKEAAKNVFNF